MSGAFFVASSVVSFGAWRAISTLTAFGVSPPARRSSSATIAAVVAFVASSPAVCASDDPEDRTRLAAQVLGRDRRPGNVLLRRAQRLRDGRLVDDRLERAVGRRRERDPAADRGGGDLPAPTGPLDDDGLADPCRRLLRLEHILVAPVRLDRDRRGLDRDLRRGVHAPDERHRARLDGWDIEGPARTRVEHPDAARAHPDLGIDRARFERSQPRRDRRAQRGLVEHDGGFERRAVQRQPDLAQGALHDAPVTAGRQGGIDERTDIGAACERAVVHRHVAGDRVDEDPALAVPAVRLLERGGCARPVEPRQVGRAHAHAREHAALVAQVPGDERSGCQHERQREPDEERNEQAPNHARPAAVDRLSDRRLECRLLDVADGGHGPPPLGPCSTIVTAASARRPPNFDRSVVLCDGGAFGQQATARRCVRRRHGDASDRRLFRRSEATTRPGVM